MRNHTYATFAYLKDKDFLVFKFFEIAYTRFCHLFSKKVQVGKDQEKAQSEKDSHSKNQGGKKPN